MPARLSERYTPTVLWQAQCPPPAGDDGPLPSEADAVIIGAGYCGLVAGRTLAEAGRSVVVVDAHELGWGASTRNGGMVIPELKADAATLERAHGDLGRRMQADVDEAFAWLERLVAEEGIDCDYVRTGQLYLAHHDRLVPGLRNLVHELQALGDDVHLVEGHDLAAEIGSTVYPAGVVFDRTGSIHPARFHAALATAAREAGAHLHADTAVREVRRDGNEVFTVTTDRGVVRSRHVIAATNAYADGAMPALRRRVLPVGSFIIATEPLDPSLAHEVSPRGRMFVDSKNFLFYWRLTPDGRMAFGGRRSLARATVEEARDFLYDAMGVVHPQLRGVALDHAWGGSVAITLDRLPHVGEIDGVLYATGCNGSGVALNSWLGLRLGRMVLGDAPPSFAELRHRPIPVRSLEALYLPLVGTWFRWRDRGFPRS
jgi:glycine/D-amino acid oxidase-like deaminating enzyme